MTGYIYRIYCKQNGESYIGQTIDLRRRKYQHYYKLSNNIHVNPKLQAAWNKYGESNFTFEYWQFDNITKEQLNELEIKYIDKYNSLNNGFNLTPGGTNPPNLQAIKNDDIIIALVIMEKYPFGYGKPIDEYFGWAMSTSSRLGLRKGYAEAWDIFDNMTQEEKDKIFQEFFPKIEEVRIKRLHTERRCMKSCILTEDDFNFAFAAQEMGYTYGTVANYIGIAPATVKDWFSGKARKRERQHYKDLDEECKNKIKQKIEDIKLDRYNLRNPLKYNKKDILSYLCYHEIYQGRDTDVQRLFGWSESSCYGMRQKNRYHSVHAEFDMLSKEEKQKLADEVNTAILKSRN